MIMEQTIATLLARVLMVRHLMLMRAFLLLQQAEYFIKGLIKHGCLTCNTLVQNQSSYIIAMIESPE